MFLSSSAVKQVNNAGLQRAKPLAEETEDWDARQQEIAINLEAPVHLSSLLTPHFLKQKEVTHILQVLTRSQTAMLYAGLACPCA